MTMSFVGVLIILGSLVVSGQMQSASKPFNNGTIEDHSEDLTEGISYTEVEEIYLGAQIDQLQNENEKLKQTLETQMKIAENLRKINVRLTAGKNEDMEKNQKLRAENIKQASQIVDLQRNLQSTQAELYTLKPKLTLLQNNLSITLQNLENATAHARDVESLLQTELYLKSTYEEEASLERQTHEITKQRLEDQALFSDFVMNLTIIQNVRMLQLENITATMDNALKIMKEKETLYMAENSAYRNEILVQQNATSKERDQKEKLKTSLMHQSQLGKTKERMLRILRNALVDMTISLPNCTSLATQAHQSQVEALLEKEDPMKHLISQFSQFNSSSIDLQNIYVQLNSELKEQIDTKNKIMDENNLLINSLENEIDDRKEIIKSQSGSLQLLTEEVNRFMPDDLRRARVRRNLDGTIKSANLCQCFPEAPKDSLLKLKEIQWSCPNDMTIFQNGSQIDPVASFPCTNSNCSVETASWPQCENIVQKQWSPWTYTNCSKMEIGNKTFLCGSGHRSRSRVVRDSSSSWSSWRNDYISPEKVSEPCHRCSLTYGAKTIMKILPSTLETSITNSISMVKVTDGGWSEYGPCTKTCRGGIQERTCTNPAPGPGGMPCTGNSTSSCNNQSCPTLFSKREEVVLKKNNIITTLPSLNKEFNIALDFMAFSNNGQYNVITLTESDINSENNGGRIPGIWILSNKKIYFHFSTGSTYKGKTVADITKTFRWINVQVMQKLENGKYMLTFHVDGKQIFREENTTPQEFNNVKVYAGSPWYTALLGSIRNFVVS